MPRILLLLALLMLPVIALAVGVDDQGNPNDPAVNERANACFEGGSLAGQCDTEWEWIAGWYLIRFQYGLISRDAFPAAYASVLPPLPETSGPGSNPTAVPPQEATPEVTATA